MIDLSDPKQVKERNLDVRRHATLRANTINTIMQHRNGREFIYWLLTITEISNNPFATNALSMSFRCGMANVGQQLLAELTTRENIDLYVQMLKEGQADDDRSADRDSRDDSSSAE